MEEILSQRYTAGIVLGLIYGIVVRLLMMRTDYRQYPTYPHGKIIHIALAFIAAGLGAVAVPALLSKEYTAVTFLTVAAQEFREVRKMERETLMKIDESELVPRGAVYIEGIAMVFEGRNYMVIFTALITTLFSVTVNGYVGALAGVIAILIGVRFKSGKVVGDIAGIQQARLHFEGPNLFVDDIHMINIGLKESREIILHTGMGFILNPSDKNARITLANPGQRQAILHNLSSILGVRRDSDEPSLIPLMKLSLSDGRVAILFPSLEEKSDQAMQILKHVPLLENAVRLPSIWAKKHGKGMKGQ